MPGNSLIIGSRGSKLALFQAHWVKSRLEENFPGICIEVKIIKTSGDVIIDAPLSQIGGKGLFTKEIEEALLDQRIDLAVHSLKDLPTILPERLCLGGVTQREDVRDAFLSLRYGSLSELPCGAVIGTSSLRRQAQLLYARRDLQVRNLRGNLDTRLRKLDEGQYDAILLASAGLNRLGYAGRITEKIPVDQICPAVGQGALGIEARSSDNSTLDKVQSLNHEDTRVAVEAERSFLKRLGGGCQVPIAGYAWIEERRLHMTGVIACPDGTQLFKATEESSLEFSRYLGICLAENLLGKGAHGIIRSISVA